MQSGYIYALRAATRWRCRSTATGSTIRATSTELLQRLRTDPELNMVTGSRFMAPAGDGLSLLGRQARRHPPVREAWFR